MHKTYKARNNKSIVIAMVTVLILFTSFTMFSYATEDTTAVEFEQEELSLDMTELSNYVDTYEYDSNPEYTISLKTGKAVRYESSDTSVAYVNSYNENSVELTLEEMGETTITAYDDEQNEAHCVLIVSATVKELRAYASWNEEENIVPGNTLQVYASVYPSFADKNPITWTSSNEQNAEVDENGLVTLKNHGPVSITANCGSISSTYNVMWDDSANTSDFSYDILDNGEIGITSYRGNDTEIEIPEEINGYKVTEINGRLYDSIIPDGLKVTKVSLPNTLNHIGEYAFYDCEYLKQITIPSSVTSVETSAFRNCRRLQTAVINSNTDLNDYIFSGCEYLSSVSINGMPKKIGKHAFYYCPHLKSIKLPEGVETIGDEAFYDTGLEILELPESIKTIGEEAFNGASINEVRIPSGLESIGNTGGVAKFIVDNANQYYSAENGVLFNKDKSKLIQHPSNNGSYHYSVPIGTAVIGKKALYYSEGLRQLDIPEGVKTIEDSALMRNWWDVSIVFPKSLTTIGEDNLPVEDHRNILYYRGSKSDWNNIDIAIYENDGLKNNDKIVFNHTINGIKLSKTKVNCTLAEYPTVGITYSDGKAIKSDDIKTAYNYDKNAAYINARKKGNGSELKVNPARIGSIRICVIAGGYAQDLDINVTGKTHINKFYCKYLRVETYSGKNIKPWFRLCDSAGNDCSSDDYSYVLKNNKNVGTAQIVITGKGRCYGTVTRTFSILPNTTYFRIMKSGKKAITVNWQKQAKQTSGYQIQYALKKNFKGAKTITIKKNKTTKKKISKLKKKKRYYLRIRTYKKIGNKYYYSDWSGTSSIKTK